VNRVIELLKSTENLQIDDRGIESLKVINLE
jgi:hypothetical protein